MAIVSTVVDAGNALHAINDLVFKKKSFSIAELLKALEANWVGFEGIQKMILNVPKYGMMMQKAMPTYSGSTRISDGSTKPADRITLATKHILTLIPCRSITFMAPS